MGENYMNELVRLCTNVNITISTVARQASLNIV